MKIFAVLMMVPTVLWLVLSWTRTDSSQAEMDCIASNTCLIISGIALILDRLDRR